MGRNMLAIGRASWVIAAGLMLTACATLRVGSDYDRTANLSAYHSFSWMPREHYGTHNPLVVQRTRDAIQMELASKGFTLVPDGAAADFVVDFTIGAHDRTDVRTYPTAYAGPWYVGPGAWWGYPYWGEQVDVRQYREGTLSIDVFDAHTRKPVWHGWAKKELTQAEQDRSEAPIREAVNAVLQQFPPK